MGRPRRIIPAGVVVHVLNRGTDWIRPYKMIPDTISSFTVRPAVRTIPPSAALHVSVQQRYDKAQPANEVVKAGCGEARGQRGVAVLALAIILQ